ncbi:unnamed protein product [Chironomus riparius]|uniref:Esophageal cancer associated protein n=1 Tax=Chironomus riparius TaxID=315576 RepID=A0A9N9RUU6_9DIPT|nr:unnamed protein product [Chironomus riparius]
MDYKWKYVKLDRNDSRKFFNFVNSNLSHPLREEKTIVFDSKGTKNRLSSSVSSKSSTLDLFDGFDDPLSQFARQELDPLSQMAAENDLNNLIIKKKSALVDTTSAVQSWNSRKAIILNKYTTSEKLSIATSFLGIENVVRSQTTVEKVKHRLEQIDDFQDIHYMQNLTQQEYIGKINQLNAELIEAWKTDQRVKSLKIAIQCSKLLSDATSVMQFYPSKFVLVTDILDIFGKLVYERLKSKSENEKSLPDKFTPDQIPESAKETCLNWFYKISSIRELLPRLYVEMCLVRCYNFINPREIDASLLRISRMIRGIGDPLVGAYARCYLVRIGVTTSKSHEYLKECFADFLSVYHTIFNTGIRAEILKQNIELSVYFSLYAPALDFIVQNYAASATDVQLEEFLTHCKDKKNSSLLLLTILHSFRPEFISSRSVEMVSILAETNNEGITKGSLFRQLGNIVSLFPPPVEQRVLLFNEAWKTISTITNVGDYMACVELWSQYIASNFDIITLNTFFGDVLTRIVQKRAFERYYNELQGLMDKVVSNVIDFHGLLSMDNFLPILDLFQKESIKFEVCKNILEKYKIFCSNDENNFSLVINDPVTINAFMCVSKALNDGVNALTSDDERRHIGNLISFFILRVNFGRDFEQQLTFYVDARGSFANLDIVLHALVNCVNKLSIDTRRIVKGNHTRKTSAFVKACTAYCFITIPSIISITQRLDLYLESGKIALANLCLGQSDASFEAAIHLLSELPKFFEIEGRQRSSETYLQSYVLKFLSLLVLVPDSPEKGVLYLLRLLIDKLNEIEFDSTQQLTTKSTIEMNILDMLCYCAQDTYPYHLQNVISNDQLYGADVKFINEINEISTGLLCDLLQELQRMSERPKQQCQMALDLFERVAMKSDLCDDKMFTLAVNLWNLSIKNRHLLMDGKIHHKIYRHMKAVRGTLRNRNYYQRFDELLNRIEKKL